MNVVRENCLRIIDRIREAAIKSDRDPQSIRLIAITKTVPPERVRMAAEAGITNIGENRLQEGLAKRNPLNDLHLTWHFIGRLQTNKAKKVTETFDWIQTVDRVEIAEKINQYANPSVPVLIEVKLDDEPSKGGVAPEQLADLVERCSNYQKLKLCGLLAIPPFSQDPQKSRPYFSKLKVLADQLGLPELSMGMSNDFEVAIEEGATMVRIGTAIFGTRG